MGLTGFNRQRKRVLTEITGDASIADRLVAHGINDPGKLKRATDEDLSFLSDSDLNKLRKGRKAAGNDSPKPLEDLTVSDLKKKADGIQDAAVLSEWIEVEKNNKNRKSAIAAIQERIDELSEPKTDPEDPEGSETEPETSDGDSEGDSEEDPKSDNTFENLPEDTEFPYAYGGGMHFLSDGTKVKGRKAAENAQAQLNEG